MASIVLDGRLGAIARMIEPCGCVADIGTDHGRLGAWLLQRGVAQRVQFLDVSADSLRKARGLIERLGLGARAVFSVGDGAEALVEHADWVVIAGMGGQLIADIVERGRERLIGSRLILQPNVAHRELRQRLVRAGFCIDSERIVRAGGRMYVLIAARKGEAHYTQEQLLVGPCLAHDPLLKSYAERRLAIQTRALRGAMQGGADWAEELRWECGVWEAIAHGKGSTDL